MKHFSRQMLRWLVAGLLASAATHSVIAQDFRIGAVSLERILRDANAAKSATAKLEQEFSRREREIQAMATQLKASSEKFDREAPTLPDSQRAQRQRQLIEQDREFQRKQREFQEDLNLRKNEELQAVIERANRVIKQVAEVEKYDLIIQEWVYINPKHDITDKVLSSLNSAK